MGQLQSFLRRSLSTRNYVLLFGVGVLAAVGTGDPDRVRAHSRAAAAAVRAAGDRAGVRRRPTCGGRRRRMPEVNAVERVHFVEYGLIAFLFYRAGLPRRSLGEGGRCRRSVDRDPADAGRVHGRHASTSGCSGSSRSASAKRTTCSSTSRRSCAGCCSRWRCSRRRRSRRGCAQRRGAASACTSAIAWMIFAAFVSQVHLGHIVEIADIGRFKSHYTAQELNDLQGDRAVRWKTQPPMNIQRLSREDQYLDEGLWHVRRRNGAEVDEAWRENLILERFFVPVLDLPTYASPNGNRWPPEQRADFANRAAATRRSSAGPSRIRSSRGPTRRSGPAQWRSPSCCWLCRWDCRAVSEIERAGPPALRTDRSQSDRRRRRWRPATARERHRASRSCTTRSSRDACRDVTVQRVEANPGPGCAHSRRSLPAACDRRRSSRRLVAVRLARRPPREVDPPAIVRRARGNQLVRRRRRERARALLRDPRCGRRRHSGSIQTAATAAGRRPLEEVSSWFVAVLGQDQQRTALEASLIGSAPSVRRRQPATVIRQQSHTAR